MSFTFSVDAVRPVKPVLSTKGKDVKFLQEGLARAGIKSGTVEAFGVNADYVEYGMVDQNTFIYTCLAAYNEHVPITFYPDEIWILILQAFAEHIKRCSEEVRHAIVPFDGKKTLEVVNEDFIKGSPYNDWARDFGKFSDQIEGFLGKKRDLFDASFSTTTKTEKVAIQIQMMAALAPYFDYRMRTRCGVPWITVQGEPGDWQAILDRVKASEEFYPSWARKPLEIVVGNFLEASKGNPQIDFWKRFFKNTSGSGGTHVSGYLNAFFPYTEQGINPLMDKGEFEHNVRGASSFTGPNLGDYYGSVGSVPMIWDYLGTIYKMKLAAGLVGRTIEEGNHHSYKTVIGWFVGEEKEQK